MNTRKFRTKGRCGRNKGKGEGGGDGLVERTAQELQEKEKDFPFSGPWLVGPAHSPAH